MFSSLIFIKSYFLPVKLNYRINLLNADERSRKMYDLTPEFYLLD